MKIIICFFILCPTIVFGQEILETEIEISAQRDLSLPINGKVLNAIDFRNIENTISILSLHSESFQPSKAFIGESDGEFYNCLTSDLAKSGIPKSFGEEVKFNFSTERLFEIPLSIHFIFRDSASKSEDFIGSLDAQLEILNRAFSPIQIEFYIDSINSISNEEWNKASPANEIGGHIQNAKSYIEMTNFFNRSNSINIYVNDMQSFKGHSSFPWNPGLKSPTDCILLNFSSLPIENSSISQGKTLIHEMGHFFGLLHTFHDEKNTSNICNDPNINKGCESGDRVADTPPQGVCRTFGCGKCKGSNSCDRCDTDCYSCGPMASEPVENFMSYNPDYCSNKFTKGQYDRMRIFFIVGRPYLCRQLKYFTSIYSKFK